MSIEEQIKVLKFFNEKATKLENGSFTKIILHESTGVKISYSKTDQPLIEILREGPGDESIDAFALTFRFFIQDNEKSSFRNMAKLYEQLPISQESKIEFNEARKELNDALDSKAPINVDGIFLTYRHIVDIFIYGGLSHANEKKKEEYDIWMLNPFSNHLVTNEFIYVLSYVISLIFYIRDLNNRVMAELEK